MTGQSICKFEYCYSSLILRSKPTKSQYAYAATEDQTCTLHLDTARLVDYYRRFFLVCLGYEKTSGTEVHPLC